MRFLVYTLGQSDIGHQCRQLFILTGGGQELNRHAWMRDPDLLNQQWEVFSCMLANPKKNGEYPYVECTSGYQISSGFGQRRCAEFQVGAADLCSGLAGADVRGDGLNWRLPLRVTRAMGEQNNTRWR
jgi:hypothetical protein